jgi:hypothetical protein
MATPQTEAAAADHFDAVITVLVENAKDRQEIRDAAARWVREAESLAATQAATEVLDDQTAYYGQRRH